LPYKAVSRHHARFFIDDEQLCVEDIGSSNGVIIAGERIGAARQLTPGDIVHIGVISAVITAAVPGTSAPPGGGADLASVLDANVPATVVTGPTIEELDLGAGQGSRDYLVLDPNAVTIPPPSSDEDGYLDPRANPLVEPLPSPEAAIPPDDPAVQPLPRAPQEPAPAESFDQGVAQAESVDQGAAPAPPPAGQVEAERTPAVVHHNPRLVGESRVVKGQVFPLKGQELTVGRAKGCGVFVDDPSISRHHARLISRDGTVVLFDLRSSNGTFVNGNGINRAELQGEEVVRFGDIRFTFRNNPSRRDEQASRHPKTMQSPRRRRLMVLIATTALLALVVVAANIWRPQSGGPTTGDNDREGELDKRVRDQLERGTTELQRGAWDAAAKAFQGVLKMAPLNEAAVTGLETARLERRRQGHLLEAVRIAETGRDLERAQELLVGIPQTSRYYADARLQLRRVRRRLAETAREVGLGHCRSRRYEKCQEELCRFFHLWPPGAPVPDQLRVQRELKGAEKRLSRRRGRKQNWSPCTLPHHRSGDDDADRQLAEMYPHDSIRQAVVGYHQGRGGDAVKSLRRLEKRGRPASQQATVNLLLQHMLRVQTASADAHRDVLDQRLDEAEKSFQVIRRSDKTILPRKMASHYQRQIGSLIANRYHQQGAEQFRAGRVGEARDTWTRGTRFAPDHPEILGSLLKLEGQAQEACTAAQRAFKSKNLARARQQYERCRELSPRNGALHREALEALQQLTQ
jgi:pSer/pThr/pTyr-binding forkhead associated (FHA) protein